MNIMHSFTLEASYLGYKNSQGHLIQFSVEDYESCGKTLLGTFFHYLPGRQRCLLLLVDAVMKAFANDFPENLRTTEIKKIKEVEIHDLSATVKTQKPLDMANIKDKPPLRKLQSD